MKTVWDVYKMHYRPENDRIPTMERIEKGFATEGTAKAWLFNKFNLTVLDYREYQVWHRNSK